jgi:acetoin utilization deacetylase AcuC-like enzyme
MVARRTGFIWHERFAWHDIGAGAGPLASGEWIEPGEQMAEHPATKRRIRNLIDVAGLLDDLVEIKPQPASDEVLQRFHTPEYIAKVEKLSAEEGGWVGLAARVGRGSAQIARLAVGASIAGLESVLEGTVDNAYALVRPLGHHAIPGEGMGGCVYNNLVLAAMHARAAHGIQRIVILDWDVHHGNGAQLAFWTDPDVLTISIHQDNWFPPDSGHVEDRGEDAGYGANVNVPLPPGSGIGAYDEAFRRIVIPAIDHFAPEFIFVACGFDATAHDPMARQNLGTEIFRRMTEAIVVLADKHCNGRIVFSSEGGYHPGIVPFCGLAVIEALSGRRTEVTDPWEPLIATAGGQDLQPWQAEAIDRAADHPAVPPT